MSRTIMLAHTRHSSRGRINRIRTAGTLSNRRGLRVLFAKISIVERIAGTTSISPLHMKPSIPKQQRSLTNLAAHAGRAHQCKVLQALSIGKHAQNPLCAAMAPRHWPSALAMSLRCITHLFQTTRNGD
ncbi:unnamed protein product [Ostreobium quekettii]|uniref:Uncharacterized protein n=1 Tax=Ostreobium quekettii TaxID=121088 RepID=A0A8S1JEN2_9CHLO|nr:unnamed protein product [Ostreobium quekettii]